MAIVVEGGTGKDNAESYVAVATVSAYAIKYVHRNADTWSKALLEEQENAAKRATRFIDLYYLQGRCIGNQYTEDQALYFPTDSFDDNRNRVVDSNEVPLCVSDATSELALEAIAGDIFLPPETEAALKKRVWKNESEGGEEHYAVSSKPTDHREYPRVEKLLEPILHWGIRVEQG